MKPAVVGRNVTREDATQKGAARGGIRNRGAKRSLSMKKSLNKIATREYIGARWSASLNLNPFQSELTFQDSM